MNEDQDFSALCNLLALKRLDLPQDTQVDPFLIEFHRRQRAQLLVPQPVWTRAIAWIKERAAGFELVPSLSYASAVAAIAIVACVSLSQQVRVTGGDGQGGFSLSFRMPARETSFAMVPGSFALAPSISSPMSDSPNFTANRTDSAATRYVLANNSHGAYDAIVAF